MSGVRGIISKLLIYHLCCRELGQAGAMHCAGGRWGGGGRVGGVSLILSLVPKCTQLPRKLSFRLMQILQTEGKNSSGQLLCPWNMQGHYIIAVVFCDFSDLLR